MKKTGHIFVDDGFPEASDYDNNYVDYDPETPGSCEAAIEEVKRRLSTAAKPAIRLDFRRLGSFAEVTPRKISRSPANGMMRNGIPSVWRGVWNGLKRFNTPVRTATG